MALKVIKFHRAILRLIFLWVEKLLKIQFKLILDTHVRASLVLTEPTYEQTLTRFGFYKKYELDLQSTRLVVKVQNKKLLTFKNVTLHGMSNKQGFPKILKNFANNFSQGRYFWSYEED